MDFPISTLPSKFICLIKIFTRGAVYFYDKKTIDGCFNAIVR